MTDILPEEEVISTPEPVDAVFQAKIGQTIVGTTSGGLTSEGSVVEYQFDWGDDGGYSDWGPSQQEIVYESDGSYNIKARSRSQSNPDLVSEWSSPFVIEIVPDEDISMPTKPTVSPLVWIGKRVIFRSGNSTSSLGNDIEYMYSWGDDTYSEWGSPIQAHNYAFPGVYIVSVSARSVLYPLNQSQPAEYLTVVVSENMPYIDMSGIYLLLFEN